MNQELFFETMEEGVREALSETYEAVEVKLQSVTKNNNVTLCGLSATIDDNNASPLLYLNDYFKRYQQGEPVESLIRQAVSFFESHKDRTPQVQNLDISFEAIEDNLRVRLVNIQSNRDLLRNTPHLEVEGGFALTPYFNLPQEVIPHGMIQVRKNMLETIGCDERQLMQAAIQGSVRHDKAVLHSMTDILFPGSAFNYLETEGPLTEKIPMLVLSNTERSLGATALFYPGIQEKIADLVGGDYFVLPSSIHEVIILPDDGYLDPKTLAGMVSEVNKTQVSPEERLGDKVLHYRADLERLNVAVDLDREQGIGKDR